VAALEVKPTQREFLLLKAQILESQKNFQESFKILGILKGDKGLTSAEIEEVYGRVKNSAKDSPSVLVCKFY